MLFRQKYLCVLFVLMMFFVIASGGCGGGSSSSNIPNDNDNPNQENPDNPNPNNPTTEYDISVLLGEWVASDGTATQREDNENFDLVMLEDGGSLSFHNIQLNGDIMSIDIDGYTHWEYLNGSRRGSQSSRNYYVDHPREFQHIGVNIWQAWYKGVDDHKYTITITSPTTATFEENINDATYGWTTHFTLTKQSATTLDINGTWRISGGNLTYHDNTEADYEYEDSSSEEFTLTMSDIGEGEYFIDVSGTGVFKKEGSPYIKAKFKGISENVRVVWGSSEDREYFGGGTEYKRTDTETYTYSAEFPSVIHDVSTASFRLSQPSRITYTQTGKSIERHDSYYLEHTTEEEPTVTVELYLSRVD